MKKSQVCLLVVMGLMLTAQMAFPVAETKIDTGGPIPLCDPFTGCPKKPAPAPGIALYHTR